MLLDERVVEHLAVAGEGADGQVIAFVVDVAQVVQPVEVDEDRGSREAQPHQRDQGVPAGYELRLVAVLTEKLYGVVDRLGYLVVEGYWLHLRNTPIRFLDGRPHPHRGGGHVYVLYAKVGKGVNDGVDGRLG